MEDDEDLNLFLSMQSDENDDDEGAIPDTPPRSPTASNEGSGGLSLAMAEMRQRYAAKVQKVPAYRRVLASPASPVKKTYPPGYVSDEDRPQSKNAVSMAIFKDIVRESLNDDSVRRVSSDLPSTTGAGSSFGTRVSSAVHAMGSSNSNDVEAFSRLRIKDRVVSATELKNIVLEVKFVRLQAIKLTMLGENFHGSWVTVGVLVDKGHPKLSTIGKKYVVWRLASLDKFHVSLTLFGEAYDEHRKQTLGSIFAIFKADVRADGQSKCPSLTVYKEAQVMKLGMSVDYGVCKGTRKDGTACCFVVNKQEGEYCQHHIYGARQKYHSKRPELAGGRYVIAGPDLGSGRTFSPISKFLPCQSKENFPPSKSVKPKTGAQLKDILSDPDMIQSKRFSQGKRFLEIIADRNTVQGVKRKTTAKSSTQQKRTPLSETTVNAAAPTSHEAIPSSFRGETSGKISGELELDGCDGPDDAMVYRLYRSSK